MTNVPLTITRDPSKNIIKVYYVKRTDLLYKIEYYYDNVKGEKEDTVDNQTFNSVIQRDDIATNITENKKYG